VQPGSPLPLVLLALGLPFEATTVLGLIGAGLTVALKDFIVAFVGWFVLMGKNGIRVGDWVEIEGVAGEVAEVGVLHTVLLETGGRSEAGHPTGRRVSFANGFALEGHFFNFTTSGQWMWDELQVTVPAGHDPYPVIDQIRLLVEQETRANAALAEAEWRASGTRYQVKSLSAVPAVTVVPSGNGVALEVRYVTRARERQAVRKRFNEAVVELLHGKRPEGAAGGPAETQAGPGSLTAS
jgi:small-conductance mechanosensitive channel